MSYQYAADLQVAMFQALSNDPALTHIPLFDAPSVGTVPQTYMAIGAETVLGGSSKNSAGAEHKVSLSVVTQAQGFHGAKQIAADAERVLAGMPGDAVGAGTIATVNFERARARHGGPDNGRRIDLTFRVFIDG
ncbi:DUF3168 domain-containing protein [Qingshengfaniella alkalisoli]|uniref:DUF3168 domain-containing protein n=1 Tax=Qingshengfaniella alkalisoli TaxID=2599296 RepID=A0A5B8IRU0_9RHOB|nr:DUF3168 domain-containing protein [Qingshengfaniella alkalisoli]QDY68922.1 DUF3168 domain-containing protein [Qingshengfaniella alkalisoli]